MTDAHLDRHRRVLNSLGHVFVLQDDPQAWQTLGAILDRRLTRHERKWLFSALAAHLDANDLVEVADAALAQRLVGAPLPVLEDVDADARWWADCAALPELKAWLAACFVRLPTRDQTEFLAHATRRSAA